MTGESQAVVKLTDIYFIREDRHILSDVQLNIEQGQHWIVLGKNGSGKTTILEMMNGYLFPSRGRVEVLGNVYGECDVREIRKQIGYISQSLFDKLTPRDPVWEVVATGEYSFLRFYQQIPEEVKEKALDMLSRVGLRHVSNQLLGSLSQGERKKIMLARTLMHSPKLVILDEPCSGLDLYEREKFLADLEILREQKMTVVYVTHHIEEIMPMFTHVALLEQGRIVAAGAKTEVLSEELLYRAFQVPVTVEWHNERPWIKV